MTTKLYDLAVATRRYQDKDGMERAVYENVGAILRADGEPYLMLKAHFLPAAIARKDGSESILVSLFAPKDSTPDLSFNYESTAGHRLYDLAVATHRWQNQNGEQKTSWLNVGAVIQGRDNRPYVMLKAHFNHAGIQRKEGSESIVISLFKPKAKESLADSYEDYSSTDSLPTAEEFSEQGFTGDIPF